MNDSVTTLEFLREIIARDFSIDPQSLHSEARLEDLAIDSLAVIEIMFAVEEKYGITIPHRRPDNPVALGTLGDLARYIDQLVSEQRGANGKDTSTA